MFRLFWVLGLLCASTLTLDQHAYAQQEQELSFEELRDQGMLYFRKKRFKQAYRSLNAAIKSPKGTEDYKANFWLARTAAKMLLLEEAFLKSDVALKLAGDSEKKKNAVNAFRADLDSKYGGIQLVPAKGETNRKGRIFLEAKQESSTKRKEVF